MSLLQSQLGDKRTGKNFEGSLDHEQSAATTPIRLCIYDRDFIPGLPIHEHILKYIDGSLKTIRVISRNCVTSSWCDYEL